jgi:glycosyltransferase involved in cell wall biosynthesis
MGAADYSYFFVLKRYIPVLEKLGHVIQIEDPELELDEIRRAANMIGEACVFLQFAPPHKAYVNNQFISVCIFAWEYSTIPTDSWGGNEPNDWRKTLGDHGAAITHSKMAVSAVMDEMGDDFLVVSAPAPLWDSYSEISDFDDQMKVIEYEGLLFDSRSDDLDVYSNMLNTSVVSQHKLELEGVIYTSVFCPSDGRKNWTDLVSAYCYAFRDNTAVTLLLKLVHADQFLAMREVLTALHFNSPFKCSVVIVTGYLQSDVYRTIIEATTYVVNSSYGEGQCLPLMEFMSSGVPAIAPSHSAMADYMSENTGYVVESSKEWTHWPHDPRVLLKTMRFRINWQSMREAYVKSYETYISDQSTYQSFRLESKYSLKKYCSQEEVTSALSRFFKQLMDKNNLSSLDRDQGYKKYVFMVCHVGAIMTSINRLKILVVRLYKLLDKQLRLFKRMVFN